MQKNEQRKSGERRGKPRLATDIEMVDLTKPTSETQNMAINKFIKRAQIVYIIEEILTLRSYATPNEELEGQEGHEIDRARAVGNDRRGKKGTQESPWSKSS